MISPKVLSIGHLLKDRFSKEAFSVGLDIGASAIKAIKLKFLQEAVQLYSFVSEPIQPDLESTLKRIIESQGIKKVNISVSGPATIIRYVVLPRMNENEFRQALKFEAPKYITFTLSEANLDACILKPDLPDNKMLVLLAAVKKELISQRLQLLQEGGLKVNIIDLDSLALINAFKHSEDNDTFKDKTVALLNIGASLSSISILEKGLPVLSRDIYIAGNNLSNLPLSELAGELRTSFDYYESQSASSVERIFLSGGGSKLSGLKDTLANLLGIEIQGWDPLNKIKISDAIEQDKLKEISCELAVAVGLALRR